MIREARLPHGRPRFQAIRKSSFNELHGPFQGNLCRGRQQRVDVIGHDDEFVEKESVLIPTMREGVDQEMGCCLASEDWAALGGDGRDKEDAVGVHSAMVVPMGERCL
jgi:hypothetical protein